MSSNPSENLREQLHTVLPKSAWWMVEIAGQARHRRSNSVSSSSHVKPVAKHNRNKSEFVPAVSASTLQPQLSLLLPTTRPVMRASRSPSIDHDLDRRPSMPRPHAERKTPGPAGVGVVSGTMTMHGNSNPARNRDWFKTWSGRKMPDFEPDTPSAAGSPAAPAPKPAPSVAASTFRTLPGPAAVSVAPSVASVGVASGERKHGHMRAESMAISSGSPATTTTMTSSASASVSAAVSIGLEQLAWSDDDDARLQSVLGHANGSDHPPSASALPLGVVGVSAVAVELAVKLFRARESLRAKELDMTLAAEIGTMLLETNKALEAEKETLTKALNEKSQKLSEKSKQLQALLSDRDRQPSEAAVAAAVAAAAAEEGEQAEGDARFYQHKLTQSRARIKTLEEELRVATQEQEKLAAEHEDSERQFRSQLADLGRQLDENRERMLEMQSVYLEKEAGVLAEAKAAVEQAEADGRQQRAQLETELAQEKAARQQIAAKLEESEKVVGQAEQVLQSAQQYYQNSMQTLKKQLKRKQDELKAAQTKIRQLQAAADEAEEMCRRQSEEIASLKLEVEAGSHLSHSLNAASATIAAHEARIAELTNAQQELTNRLNQSIADADELRGRLAARSSAPVAASGASVGRTDELVQELESSRRSCSAALRDAREARQQLTQSNRELASLRAELAALTALAVSVPRALPPPVVVVERTKDSAAPASPVADDGSLRSDLQSARALNDQLRQLLTRAENERDASRVQWQTAMNNVQTLTMQWSKTREELQRARAELAELQRPPSASAPSTDVLPQPAHLAAARKEIELLRTEVNRLSSLLNPPARADRESASSSSPHDTASAGSAGFFLPPRLQHLVPVRDTPPPTPSPHRAASPAPPHSSSSSMAGVTASSPQPREPQPSPPSPVMSALRTARTLFMQPLLAQPLFLNPNPSPAAAMPSFGAFSLDSASSPAQQQPAAGSQPAAPTNATGLNSSGFFVPQRLVGLLAPGAGPRPLPHTHAPQFPSLTTTPPEEPLQPQFKQGIKLPRAPVVKKSPAAPAPKTDTAKETSLWERAARIIHDVDVTR